MAITVFSLKPARTSFMTEAFVNGGSGFCCALAELARIPVQRQIKRTAPLSRAVLCRMVCVLWNVMAVDSILVCGPLRFLLARALDDCILAITPANSPHVISGFTIRRHLVTILGDGAFTGVVTRK